MQIQFFPDRRPDGLIPMDLSLSHIEWQMRGYEIRVGSFPDRLSVGADETSDKKAGAGLFFAEIDEIRRKYAVPSAYKAYADALNLNRAENAGSAGLQKR